MHDASIRHVFEFDLQLAVFAVEIEILGPVADEVGDAGFFEQAVHGRAEVVEVFEKFAAGVACHQEEPVFAAFAGTQALIGAGPEASHIDRVQGAVGFA